ncbi:MAG: branched-chain amino acid aminotransferase [Bacteroidota bacterium]
MTASPEIKITRTTKSRLAETDFNNLQFGTTFSDHMFTADYADGEWRNLEIVPYGDIILSPACTTLHYGQAFFEGLKAYNHPDNSVSIFRMNKNAERFNHSADRLCMPDLPEELFMKSISALVDIDRDWVPAKANHSLYIRPFMFATEAYLGVTPSKTYKYMVLTCPVGPYFSKPLRVKIETNYTRAAEGGYGYAKAAGNYGGAMLPTRKAVEEGFDQLIWTDSKEHKYIEELGAANAMFVLDGKLVTPAIDKNTILKGVTRDTILTLARDMGYTVEERPIAITELVEGAQNGKLTDAFGAGTAFTIAPIASFSYNDEEYFLNDPATREFSTRALKALNDIRYGIAADTHGWNYVV